MFALVSLVPVAAISAGLGFLFGPAGATAGFFVGLVWGVVAMLWAMDKWAP